MMKYIIFAMTACMTLLMPQLAHAQFSSDPGADTFFYSDDTESRNGVITLTGQADIRQGDVRLLADKVEIYTDGSLSLIHISEPTRPY